MPFETPTVNFISVPLGYWCVCVLSLRGTQSNIHFFSIFSPHFALCWQLTTRGTIRCAHTEKSPLGNGGRVRNSRAALPHRAQCIRRLCRLQPGQLARHVQRAEAVAECLRREAVRAAAACLHLACLLFDARRVRAAPRSTPSRTAANRRSSSTSDASRPMPRARIPAPCS